MVELNEVLRLDYKLVYIYKGDFHRKSGQKCGGLSNRLKDIEFLTVNISLTNSQKLFYYEHIYYKKPMHMFIIDIKKFLLL